MDPRDKNIIEGDHNQMVKMKKYLFLTFSILSFLSGSAQRIKNTVSSNQPLFSFVDKTTPPDVSPQVMDTSVSNQKWRLAFSDEFNDTVLDTSKWTIEKVVKNRPDIVVYSDENQVEEKDGNAFIYYRKSPINDTTYLVGRFYSKQKYSFTYGFIETRMHVVKPYGHQMAFWMMPEGKGMKYPDGVDSSANDGAEIDIIESTKANAYSNGLHWDSYQKPYHKSNGQLIKTPGIHEEEYHVYGLEWTNEFLKFYYDGKVIRTINNPKLIPHVEKFIWFSGMCFGENNWLDGDIRCNEFIQKGGVDKAYIDYIRVYQYPNP